LKFNPEDSALVQAALIVALVACLYLCAVMLLCL
jgi:hypothetical protein